MPSQPSSPQNPSRPASSSASDLLAEILQEEKQQTATLRKMHTNLTIIGVMVMIAFGAMLLGSLFLYAAFDVARERAEAAQNASFQRTR
jgi:hypothetical protein